MGYAKQETINKQKKLVSKAQRNNRKLWINVFKIFLCCIITGIIACAGAGFGMMKGILDNAKNVDEINIIPSGFKSIIYDKDGNEIQEIIASGTNRTYVFYDDIPKDIVNAFVAIEDERFWQHNGIDVRGILRAGVRGIASVMKGGDMNEGASTITQQLIKIAAFNTGMDETTFLDKLERKIQEQYLALELEKKYTKKQILEYYLNTIYVGRSAYGIQAASEKYFEKDMTELTLSEITVIAGITQNPYKYDPTRNPEENAKRRKRVLDKMLELEYITQAQYNEAMADDVYARISEIKEIQEANESVNSYYIDALLDSLEQDLMELYGCTEAEASTMIFSNGYSIYSVQDDAIQAICENVINDTSYYGNGTRVGLDYYLTLVDENNKKINYSTGHLLKYYKEQTGNSKYNAIYPNEESARAAAEQFKEAMLNRTGATYDSERVVLSPQPQFAFTIMDQKTGFVKAIVGGRGEKTANRGWNRATQTTRQPGSCFKILAAYLPYIDAYGGSLASAFTDEEFRYYNGVPVRNWWGASYRGPVSVRTAIRDSMNVIAVKAITEVTPQVAYEYLVNLGMTTIVDEEVINGEVYSDIQQATALGGLTKGVTNLEINAAYAAIANGGVYTKPVFYSKVLDHDGNVIIDNTTPTTHRAMKATTAWLLTDAMKTVLTGGTGTSARMKTGIKCAGKTGTTSNTYDLYFCGMTPYYTASIWMGFDQNVDMSGYSGSTHTKMWRDIMDQIATMEGQDPNVDFERPEGIGSITVCQVTGLLPIEGCPTFTDYCAVGTGPGVRCGGHERIEFCRESKCRATNACPEKVGFVIEVDPKTGAKKLIDAEDGFVYTEEICPLHPEDSNMVTITTMVNGVGGTVSPGAQVEKGTNFTFFVTPNDGYRIASVTVNGNEVGGVTQHTIMDVQVDVTVIVTFESTGQGPQPPQPTTDTTVPPGPTTETPTTEAPTTVAPTTETPTTEPPTEPIEGVVTGSGLNGFRKMILGCMYRFLMYSQK